MGTTVDRTGKDMGVTAMIGNCFSFILELKNLQLQEVLKKYC